MWGAIEAGAAGFVLKDSSAEDLIAAVRAVAGGGAWFDPGVAPRVLDWYRRVVAPATRDAARLGSAYGALGGNGELRGVAIWLGPEKFP